MKYQKDDVELAKQDRHDSVKNLVMNDSDLSASVLNKNSILAKKNGDQPDADEEDLKGQSTDIDENLLREMCTFSNDSTASNIKKSSGKGSTVRAY